MPPVSCPSPGFARTLVERPDDSVRSETTTPARRFVRVVGTSPVAEVAAKPRLASLLEPRNVGDLEGLTR